MPRYELVPVSLYEAAGLENLIHIAQRFKVEFKAGVAINIDVLTRQARGLGAMNAPLHLQKVLCDGSVIAWSNGIRT